MTGEMCVLPISFPPPKIEKRTFEYRPRLGSAEMECVCNVSRLRLSPSRQKQTGRSLNPLAGNPPFLYRPLDGRFRDVPTRAGDRKIIKLRGYGKTRRSTQLKNDPWAAPFDGRAPPPYHDRYRRRRLLEWRLKFFFLCRPPIQLHRARLFSRHLFFRFREPKCFSLEDPAVKRNGVARLSFARATMDDGGGASRSRQSGACTLPSLGPWH